MSAVHDPETLRGAVRQRYAQIAADDTAARTQTSGCCGSPSAAGLAPEASAQPAGGQRSREACCGPDAQARTLGYSPGDLAAVPEGSNLGLGCGNPVAIASLKRGQTVLDLGAGAGFDAFLAARAVGPEGRVIGVDMTSEMVTKARANARKGGYAQVEFRLGEIEALPVADATVDVIISNCVINLCPDKAPVYREAFRVLRPGGRIAVSDVVARRPLPDAVRADLALHSGCLAGATLVTELQTILEEAGFTGIVIRPKSNTDEVITSWDAKKGFEQDVFAAEVLAVKPAGDCGANPCCQ